MEALKIWIDGPETHQEMLHDVVRGFPFSLSDSVHADSPEDADFIHVVFHKWDTGVIRKIANQIMGGPVYQEFPEKFVWKVSFDDPGFAKKCKGVKFVTSPFEDREENKKHNVIGMPIYPWYTDYALQQDTDYTKWCREQEKLYDFAFIGHVEGCQHSMYGGRKWLRKLKNNGLPNYYLHSAHHNANFPGWMETHREWMKHIGQSKLGFSPSGSIHATLIPRNYYTMQVGTVPIITDCWNLPFDDEVDWDGMAFIVNTEDKLTYDWKQLLEHEGYRERRERVIQFWEDYCTYQNCARRLVEKYLIPRLG
jgi:hypothetical protein